MNGCDGIKMRRNRKGINSYKFNSEYFVTIKIPAADVDAGVLRSDLKQNDWGSLRYLFENLLLKDRQVFFYFSRFFGDAWPLGGFYGISVS